MYNKLFTKILDSSIWLAPDPVRLVWITMIAAMDEDGNCMFACAANVAARARVEISEAEEAIALFEAPDPYSGDPDNEGRRIERIPGGWHLLNAHKYRAMVTKAIIREQTRARTEKYRDLKALSRNCDAPVTHGDAPVTHGDAPVTHGDAKQGLCDAPVTTSVSLSQSTSQSTEKNTKTPRKRGAPSALVSMSDLVKAGVDRQNAEDWLTTRRAKNLPLTATALAAFESEASKAGLSLPDAVKAAAVNGWAGFKAAWLRMEAEPPRAHGRPSSADISAMTTPFTDTRADEFKAHMALMASERVPPPAHLLARRVAK